MNRRDFLLASGAAIAAPSVIPPAPAPAPEPVAYHLVMRIDPPVDPERLARQINERLDRLQEGRIRLLQRRAAHADDRIIQREAIALAGRGA